MEMRVKVERSLWTRCKTTKEGKIACKSIHGDELTAALEGIVRDGNGRGLCGERGEGISASFILSACIVRVQTIS
jgi:hypothetical protein